MVDTTSIMKNTVTMTTLSHTELPISTIFDTVPLQPKKLTIELSIVIPTYKRGDLLEECILSIACQSVTPKEIIIGNDFPGDIVDQERLTKKYNMPIIVINRPVSLGQARNVDDLIGKSKAEWLMILHDDDKLIQNSLERFFSYTFSAKTHTLIFGKQKLIVKNIENTDCEANTFNSKFNRNEKTSKQSFFSIVMNQSIPSNGFIINREYCKSIGYIFQASFGNYGVITDACDYAFTWNLYLNNSTFKFVNEFTTLYRINEFSVSSSRNVTILESFLVEFDIIRSGSLSREQYDLLIKKARRRLMKSFKTCFRIGRLDLVVKIFSQLPRFYGFPR